MIPLSLVMVCEWLPPPEPEFAVSASLLLSPPTSVATETFASVSYTHLVDGARMVHDLLRQVEGVPFRYLEALLKGMDLQFSRGLNELRRAGAAFGLVD